MSGQRLFVAIDLPAEIAECLIALDPHYRGLIFAGPEQVHLTLAFFAKVEPPPCNLPIGERAWTPHFTIGRARGVSSDLMRSFLKKHRDLDAGMFRVDAFHLYHSQLTAAGPIHQRLLTIKAQQST